MSAAAARPSAAARPPMPRGVWALGLVSLLMDTSSEMVHGILPLFLVSTLGASVTSLGLIEGTAEAVALITRIFSGVASDRLRRRKPLVLAGYGLAAATKPLFALATSVGHVFTARFVDRVGKGLRGAPRDALIADLVPPAVRGAAYGLRQSFDTVGAFLGPLLATALLAAGDGGLRLVLWIAVVPALLSVATLATAIREPPAPPHDTVVPAFSRAGLAALGGRFWGVVGVGLLLSLARFSEAFLLLRAADVGVAAAWVPMLLVVMNVAYAASSYPVGLLSDRLGRRGLLASGTGLLVAAYLTLARLPGAAGVLTAVVLWGLHLGFTQGLLAAWVADASGRELRGTAFGLFNLAAGLALLGGNLLAGWLWDRAGAPATFALGAALAAVALAAQLAWRPARREAVGAG